MQALLLKARAALADGQVDQAEKLARQGESFKLPEQAFGPQDDRPWMVLLEVQRARARTGVVTAGGTTAASAATAGAKSGGSPYPATQAVYDPANDTTRNQTSSARMASVTQASADEPTLEVPDRLPILSPAQSAPAGRGPVTNAGGATPESIGPDDESGAESAQDLFKEGEQALRDRNVNKAREYFRKAYALKDQLDAVTAQRLQDHLQLLSAPSNAARPTAPEKKPTDEAQLLVKQLGAEVARQQLAFRKAQESDPRKAAELLSQTRTTIQNSEVDATVKAQFLKRVDANQAELEKYVADHRAQLELDAQNKEVKSEIESRRLAKLEIDSRLAKIADDFNKLVEEKRFPEAEVLAKRAVEIAPNNPFSAQLMLMVKMASRNYQNQQLIDNKEDLAWRQFQSTEESAIPFDDREPIVFGDINKWNQITGSKYRRPGDARSRRSERELDIERKLRTPVSIKFRNKPLNEVLDELAKLAAVNLHLDPRGLQEEGVSTDTLVTLDLSEPITLRSALNLILEPLHLSYVIKDEVLKITSEQLKDGEIYPVTYSVADLVIPIPNFVPSPGMGLGGAIGEAYRNSGAGGVAGMGMNSASDAGQPERQPGHRRGESGRAGADGPGECRQQRRTRRLGPHQPHFRRRAGRHGRWPASRLRFADRPDHHHHRPHHLGRSRRPGLDRRIPHQPEPGHQPDAGSPRTDRRPARRSCARCRICKSRSKSASSRSTTTSSSRSASTSTSTSKTWTRTRSTSMGILPAPGAVVGLNPPAGNPPNYTANLDIPFSQNSFSLAMPQFGQPVDVAHFGFAILSDIEAYFLVNASQGDRRSNVLQAPKVTLFNGQQAFVSDTSQTPFVISVIPVVGDFAAAQQPVIVVLSEGTFMTVQAVVSNDRRFVRLTIVPFFSQIGNVQEFTFQGAEHVDHHDQRLEQHQRSRQRRLERHLTDDRQQQRHYGAVADILLRDSHDHGQRARRRHRALGRHQTLERRPQRIRRADS